MCLRTLAAVRALAALAALCIAAGAAGAQAVTLATDAASVPYHTVVHLTASASAGPITFVDNGNPIATLPLGPQGTAVLGTATLAAGTHSLTATSTAGTSTSVQVTVTTLPAPFQLTADNLTVMQHSVVNLAVANLLPRATGTITYADNGASFTTSPIDLPIPQPTYQALGDSITVGLFLADHLNGYPQLFAAANGFLYYSNLAASGAVACDTFTQGILPYHAGATQDAAPLYSLLIGSNDMDISGVPLGEPNYQACHQADLAWLGIPREYKILAGDPGATILSGPWSLPPSTLDSTYGTLYNASGSGAASFAVTSNGGPLYLWYLIGDHLTGAFTVSVDGTPTGTTYSTHPAAPISSRNNPDSAGIALLRLPTAAGPHILRVDIASGTVGILGAATPPSPGSASVHPTVFSADVPNQNSSQAFATPDMIQQYSTDALADLALLKADGLDLRPFPTHAFLTGDPAEFVDYVHPNVLGHQRLFAALQTAYGTSSSAPYVTYYPSIPRANTTLDDVGQHTLTASYAGDSTYAPYTASVLVNVVATGESLTTLTAPATTWYAGQPIPLTAGIFPANPGGSVALMEGQTVLATGSVAQNTAVFSISNLAPGIHTLYAAYAGTSDNAASVSPALSLQVLKDLPTVTLTTPAAELAYAEPLALSALVTPGTATGTVVFSDSYTPNGQSNAQATQALGQATLNSTGGGAAASLTLGLLAPGTHTITATYAGDANDAAATSAATTTVVGTITTLTTLAASPAAFGQPSTFTATVNSNGPAPTGGSVTFTDALSAASVQVAVANGIVTWTTSTLSPGAHTITAAYSGDPTHAASAAASLTTVIARDPSSLTLTTSASSLHTGTAVTLGAILSPAAATGTVLFSDPSAGTLGQAAVTAGSATLTLASLPPGTYTVTAQYSGDPDTLPSTSNAAPLQVLSTVTSTTLSAPATALYAAAANLTATVSPATSGGLVRFLDNGALVGTISLADGIAALSISTLTVGSHTLTAVYPGDATHAGSTGMATLSVTPASSSTTASLTQSTLLAGSPATVNVRISTAAAVPTGTVTLRSGSTVVATAPLSNAVAGAAYATLSVPTFAAGTYPLTAFYSGDHDIAASDSSAVTLAYTVSPRVATGTLTLSATQVPPQTAIALTATFTSPGTSGPALVPTGTVTFLSGTTALATVTLDASGRASATMPPAPLGKTAVSVVYSPSGVFTASAIPAQTLTVTPPLAVAFTTNSITMNPASTADATAALTTLSGYQGTVTTQCNSPQTYFTCTVDAPATLTGSATVKVHLTAAGKTAALTLPGGVAPFPSTRLATAVALALLLPIFALRRQRLPRLFFLLLTAALANTLTGCAEGGTFGQVPAGSYLVQLTATAANTPATASLTVNVQ